MDQRNSDMAAERAGTGRRRLPKLLGMAIAATAIVAITFGGISALHLRAQSASSAAPPAPLPVETAVVEMTDAYAVQERFAGRLEAAREASLAFERSGLVVEVALDEGERVAAGDVVARLDLDPLRAQRDRLVARRNEASANLELAQLTAERQQRLAKQGHSSQQRYDEARLEVSAIRAGIAQIDAEIRALDIDIAKSEVKAPFAGTIAARFVDEGNIVQVGTPVLHLLETGRLQARIGLPPRLVGQLQADQTYALQANGREVAARLRAIRPDLATGTRTVPVLFEIDGTAAAPLGEVVTLEIERQVPEQGSWLPIAALSEGQKGLWTVFTVVEQDGERVTQREAVEILHVANDRVYVRGSLTDGAIVVRNGLNRIAPGQRVALADQ